ncbi:type II toxin-antitoxin system VapC family toxin [Nocardioides sp. BYT-33-1]|uniref:type II toxin-antitoxin system VapC family toxin n=1 Tax=Nocardioides sp. BYT-33-1 TaxID=3416952 RepID=UPI003F534945
MRAVIDASSVVDLLESTSVAARTREIVGDGPLHAPDLVTAEVVSALARRARAGWRGTDRALRVFGEMPITRHDSHPLLSEAWRLRGNIRVTDGFYVALARSLGVPLVTSDARLGRAVEQQALCDVRTVS